MGPSTEEGVEDFAAEHGDGFVGSERLGTEVDGEIRGGDDFHLGDVAIDEMEGDGEFIDHAERDGAAAGLGGRRAAFKEKGLNSA